MDNLIQKIEEIPTIPIVSQRIMQISGDDEAPFKDFVRIIEKDQADEHGHINRWKKLLQ